MPGRIARSSVSQSFSSKPSSTRRNTKRKSRTQDAFALAAAENPDHTKVRQHRLGESELDAEEPRHKKQRMLDEEDDEEDEPASNARRRQQKVVNKGERGHEGFDEEDVSSGSDSDGNHWRVGPGEEEDGDESVDSDAAFGESDEERFEDYAFRGSKSLKAKPKRVSRQQDDDEDGGVNLNEEEQAGSDDDGASDDSLGSDAIDLATALDQADEDEEDEADDSHTDQAQEAPRGPPKKTSQDDWAGFSDSDKSDGEGRRAFDSDEDEEDEESSHTDDEAAAQPPSKFLKDIASTFGRAEGDDTAQVPQETATPQAMFAMLQQLAEKNPDIKLPKIRKEDMPALVALPKRQQDRIDRSAAYKEAKKTLDRWQDTVKRNRRAEHLHFPLVDPEEQNPQGENKIVPATTDEPRNELETAIEGILQQSGLATQRKKKARSKKGAEADEEEVDEDNEEGEDGGDDLPEQKKLSKREERARVAELRRAREMIFQEEQRAKRIKKIKSKAYRRIHRKERGRNDEAERAERQMLVDEGLISEDEEDREKHDRRRAEERMGGRHRDSKWSKSMKATNRGAWDDDARAGLNDMNARNQDLRARFAAREASPGSSVDDIDSDSDAAEFQLREKMDQLNTAQPEPKSKLASMKFMQRTDEARRKQNDEDIRRMRKDLDGVSDASESEPEINMGRRIFGPQPTQQQQKPAVKRNELEEGDQSDEDRDIPLGVGADAEDVQAPSKTTKPAKTGKSQKLQPLSKGATQVQAVNTKDSAEASKNNSSPATADKSSAPSDPAHWKTVHFSPPASPKHDGKTLINGSGEDVAASGDEEVSDAKLALRSGNIDNQALVEAAFGIDESAEKSFEAEKKAAEESEDDKFESTALPGWGSWAGEGLSKRALDKGKRLRSNPRLIKKTQSGVAKDQRKDKSKANVILSEKKIRKNGKYRADALPHPFESKGQYERSLRVPIGAEWNTKEALQRNVKPRVMVKQGIIKPMRKPLV